MKYSQPMQSIILTIHTLATTYKKPYCYPSQNKILQLLREHYSISIRKRQLNYILADLEREGFIDRKRRIKKTPSGKIIFASTLYWLKKRAYSTIGSITRIIKNTGFKLRERTKRSPEKTYAIEEAEQYGISEEQRNKNLKQLTLLIQEVL